MPLKIIRNDITKMKCDAIVNTANANPVIGPGCDYAIYQAAGKDELLDYRVKNVGFREEGEAFLTPAFNLSASYIIHAVSPRYIDGNSGEEEKLRSCYQNSLILARQYKVHSIAFPLIATGSFAYPKEEGLRIAIDEISSYLENDDMQVFLVVFGSRDTILGKQFEPDLEAYIDNNYVREKRKAEYCNRDFDSEKSKERMGNARFSDLDEIKELRSEPMISSNACKEDVSFEDESFHFTTVEAGMKLPPSFFSDDEFEPLHEFDEEHESKLQERISHLSDTFSEYLLYLIESKAMTNAEVYKRAIVDKKVFSKIKNNPDYHPQKMTCMCLCIGARLNLDETKDILSRAGYALSPCDKTDVIFSYFIENGIYDMIELDIQLEEHGLKCLIS